MEERRKLIFPSDWDLSEGKSLSGTGHRGVVEYDGCDLDRMYGPTWFLNNVAKEAGLSDDLQKVFGGNVEMAQDVLTSIDLSTGAKAIPSMSAILEEMQTIRCIEHDGRRKFITPFVGDQLLICDAFGFEVPEGCRPTYISKKSNKGKRGRPPKPQTENS